MKELNDCELMGDALDEYKAIQEAEAGIDPEMASDAEILKLLKEVWEEEAAQKEEEPYTEEDAFRDFISDRYAEFN